MTACTEDDPVVVSEGGLADVIVINEGNFQSGDGTFSSYNIETEEVTLSVFAGANGFPIAATIQNAILLEDRIFAVTNAPDKLEVLEGESFKSIAYINSGFANPYAFAAVGDKGYVTNWGTLNTSNYTYENPYIAVVDLTTYAVIDSIFTEVKPQDVVAVNGNFYVSNVGGNTISVYNASNDEVVMEIEVPDHPDDLAVDKDGDVWVITNSGSIVQVDTETNSVVKTISNVQNAGFNETMVINDAGDKLYYLASSGYPDYETAVYELPIASTKAPEAALLSGNNFYGLGISPNNVLFLADANAFQGNGTVTRYDLDGKELGSFEAGRGPSGFIFR